MALLLNRFHDRGLYILDEPEAALSPTRNWRRWRGSKVAYEDTEHVLVTRRFLNQRERMLRELLE